MPVIATSTATGSLGPLAAGNVTVDSGAPGPVVVTAVGYRGLVLPTGATAGAPWRAVARTPAAPSQVGVHVSVAVDGATTAYSLPVDAGDLGGAWVAAQVVYDDVIAFGTAANAPAGIYPPVETSVTASWPSTVVSVLAGEVFPDDPPAGFTTDAQDDLGALVLTVASIDTTDPEVVTLWPWSGVPGQWWALASWALAARGSVVPRQLSVSTSPRVGVFTPTTGEPPLEFSELAYPSAGIPPEPLPVITPAHPFP